MTTLLSDLDLLTKDYIGNYSTGTSKDDVRYRAENRAIEYCKRIVGIPNDEGIYSFYFSADQLFYDLPAKVSESLYLMYNNQNLNKRETKFEYFDYPTVLQSRGNTLENRWSIANINGKKQLIVSGYNIISGQTILSLDDITGWAVSDDASGLASDTNQKYEGDASISFDVTYSTGVATLTYTGTSLNFESLFENRGYIKLYQYLTDNNIDSVTLKLTSSIGNYYTITITTADDGTAFSQDAWQKIGFFTDDAIITGSPDPSVITDLTIEYALPNDFVSAADFRIDSIFTSYPDKMDLIFLSNIKGTATDGVTEKSTLDTPTDVLYYSDDYDDYTDLIAQRAALSLWPQLRGDKDQYRLLKAEFNENLRTFARRYPRKRVQGTSQHTLRR